MSAYEKLPPGTRSIEWSAILEAWDDTVDSIRSQLEPSNFTAQYLNPVSAIDLDWLSETSLWRGLWQAAWSDSTKRSLLVNQVWIWQNRYDAIAVLPKMFEWFGLDAAVDAVNGFKLGIDTLPATLGVPLGSYRVTVAPTYTPGTLERLRVENIMDSFGLPIRFPIVLRS